MTMRCEGVDLKPYLERRKLESHIYFLEYKHRICILAIQRIERRWTCWYGPEASQPGKANMTIRVTITETGVQKQLSVLHTIPKFLPSLDDQKPQSLPHANNTSFALALCLPLF